MSLFAKADFTPLKYQLDHYAITCPGVLSPPTSPQFPSLVHPRSYRPYIMSQSYSGGDGVEDGTLVAVPATEVGLASPLTGGNIAPPASSSHPSRPSSPLPLESGPYYASYPSSRSVGNPVVPPRAPSTESASFPSRTPELELDHGSRSSSINRSSTIKVVQWTPQRGEEGTQVTIILDSSAVRFPRPSLHQSSSTPIFGEGPIPDEVNRTFSVMFGRAIARTDFTRAQAIDGNGVGQDMSAGPNEEDAFVVLTTFAPARSAMGPMGEPVMVVVRVLDEAGETVDSSIIGNWDSPSSPSRALGLKRSGDSLVSDRAAPGMSAGNPVHNGSPSRSGLEWSAPPAAPQIAIPAIHTSAADSDPSIIPPTPSHNLGGQPELVRTSQISGTKTGSGASYSNKVVLKLQGDLNTMAMGWSNEEWQNRRRLIQFWPQQDGNIVNVAFRPVAQNDWQPNSITVSCIFRDDWNECFVTSVDTIYLLEALVGSRFSVEEKNRIRRNLEGFKPLTVSKSKPDAEPFFKLIMGFPQPKPRNIEKDVKVFPWKILSNALKKIMSKYSANYPLGPDGTPAVASFSRVDTSARLAAPVSPRLSNSPASPTSQANQSPHLPQSPALANSTSQAHFTNNATPQMSQSPRLANSYASVPRSPHVQSVPHSPSIPHSPQRMSNLVPPSASSFQPQPRSYDLPNTYDSREYLPQQPQQPQGAMYASSSNGSVGPQHQLFPVAEDYGINSHHQQQHHLAPIQPNMTHYRSYSEGLPRTAPGNPPAVYPSAPQPFMPYDASPHSAPNFYSQSQTGWMPPASTVSGETTGGNIVDGNQA